MPNIRNTVRAALARWPEGRTARELADETGLTVTQCHSALDKLLNLDQAKVVGTRDEPIMLMRENKVFAIKSKPV